MVEEESTVVESTMTKNKGKEERKKTEKKKSKKRKKSENDNDNDSVEPLDKVKSKNVNKEGKDDSKIPKKKEKKEVKSKLKSKKEEKTELIKKIPLKNEDGIAYTKFQIRQMMKRVKRGLPPVATPKELDEKRQNDARLRREEEAELLGLASTRNIPDSDDNDGNSRGEDEGEIDNNENNSDDENDEQEKESSADPTVTCTPVPSVTSNSGEAKKKLKQNKPIPSDYICQACKNRHTPAHWIYDCPDKVTVRGTNKKRKKERGVNDPDAKKVFVSGLPFDVKAKAVEDFFSVTKNCGTVAAVRLVKFEDTKRCNGQAYISFDTDEGAQRAITLSGTTLDAEELSSPMDGTNSKKKKDDGESPAKRKQLKLKVSKVLNRRKTTRVHAGKRGFK